MPVFNGPNSVLFFPSLDAASKLAARLLKQQNCVVFAGTLGDTILDHEDVRALATAPPREQSIAEVVGVLQGGVASIASILNAPVAAVAHAVGAIAKQQPEKTDGGAAASTDAAATPVAA